MDSTRLMDTKLRCAFELPTDANSQNDLNAGQEEKISRSKHEDVSASKSHKVSTKSLPLSFNFVYIRNPGSYFLTHIAHGGMQLIDAVLQLQGSVVFKQKESPPGYKVGS